MQEKRNKCNILDLLRSRSIFFRNDSSKQKRFHLSARELHNECSGSVYVEVICFEYLQQGSYEKLNFGIFLQDYLQPNASQVPTMMSLWKMITAFRSLISNFLSLHYVTCFVRQILQTLTEKLQTSTEGLCKLEKYAFLRFKKTDFYFWWEENTS